MTYREHRTGMVRSPPPGPEYAETTRTGEPGALTVERFRTLIAAGALLLGVLVGTEAGPAQAPPVAMLVDPTPDCPNCSIGVSRSLVLEAGPDGLGFSDSVLGYLRGSAGFVVVDQVGFPGRFILLNPSGRFVSTIGRPGDGPGEFLMAGRPVPSEGDSLFLYDVRRRAVSVFDPEGTFARRFSLPASPGVGMGSPAILRFDDGGMVMNAVVRTSSGIGSPLHFLDGTGRSQNPSGAARAQLHPRRN